VRFECAGYSRFCSMLPASISGAGSSASLATQSTTRPRTPGMKPGAGDIFLGDLVNRDPASRAVSGLAMTWYRVANRTRNVILTAGP
jgi:hypothetical protein